MGGQIESVTIVEGGNQHLRPETGLSRTLGLSYSGKTVPDLQAAITYWNINETNSIQVINPFTLLANAELFPGSVVRGPPKNGAPGEILDIVATAVNFGEIRLSGFDYEISYKYPTSVGLWTTSLSAVETNHYTAALAPGIASTERSGKASDDSNWAPRWKGTVALGWKFGPWDSLLDARYVDKYQDYSSSNVIGNLWFTDLHVRYGIGQGMHLNIAPLRNSFVELGAVNLFNRLPQRSNYFGGSVGYDPAVSDIRGRFAYLQLGGRW